MRVPVFIIGFYFGYIQPRNTYILPIFFTFLILEFESSGYNRTNKLESQLIIV